MWARGRLNRWFWHSPGRMITWYVAAPTVTAAGTVGLALSGGRSWWVLAVVTVVLAWQSVVYGPRAWRAYRS
jgi:hypothetical protein